MRSTPHQDFDDAAENAADAAKTVADKATDAAGNAADKATDAANNVADKATDAANNIADKATDAAKTVANKASDVADTVADKATNAADAASQKLGATADAATQKVNDAVEQGKDWLQDLDIDQLLEQIPQPLRDLGTQVVARVRSLSPTQQIVGGALLAFSVGLLTTHSSRKARKADAKAGKKYRAKYD